ncbi:MAG: hypothetical protein JWM32_2742 [Verrucomicrobia bacterium]|nr:hypothetical protein [Verrucomicrobiota bacterium]
MYRAEIIRLMDFAPRSVDEELEKLRKLELVTSSRDGNRVYYAANKAHPLYPEMRSIVLKTAGLGDVLRAAVTNSAVDFAFVFGSIAALTEKAESDVDLMVIGAITERTLSTLLRGASEQIGREINPHVFTSAEFSRRLSVNDHFLRDVLAKPKLFLVGPEHEFAELAQRGMDSAPSIQP